MGPLHPSCHAINMARRFIYPTHTATRAYSKCASACPLEVSYPPSPRAPHPFNPCQPTSRAGLARVSCSCVRRLHTHLCANTHTYTHKTLRRTDAPDCMCVCVGVDIVGGCLSMCGAWLSSVALLAAFVCAERAPGWHMNFKASFGTCERVCV